MKINKVVAFLFGVILIASLMSFSCRKAEEAPPTVGEEELGVTPPGEQEQPPTPPSEEEEAAVTPPAEEAAETVVTSVKLVNPNNDELELNSKRISRHAKIAILYEGPKPEEYSLKYKGNDVPVDVVEDTDGKMVLKPEKPMHNVLKFETDPNDYSIEVGDFSGSFNAKAAGDINGDGLSDFIVGAPDYDDGSHKGAAFVFFGKETLDYTSYDGADVKIFNNSSNDMQVGAAVALGDVNGDGYDDIAVGAPHWEQNNLKYGRAYVFYGGENVQGEKTVLNKDMLIYRLYGNQSGKLGNALAVSDVNGDGVEDVIVAEFLAEGKFNGIVPNPSHFGAVHVVFGRVDRFSSPVVFTDQQPEGTVSFEDTSTSFSHVGESIVAADVDGNGIDDIIIGAPSVSGKGKVYIILGNEDLASSPLSSDRTLSLQDTKRFGISLAAVRAGDPYRELIFIGAEGKAYINNYGYDPLKVSDALSPRPPSDHDLIVGWTGGQWAIGDPDSSRFYYTLGPWQVKYGQPTTKFGCAISPAGDLDGDGDPDFLVGEENRRVCEFSSGGGVRVNGSLVIEGQCTNSVESRFGAAVAGGRIR